jgi:hypothetical protein
MAYFFILLGALLRVIPHPGNFAPIAAMALFGGTYLSKKQAIILPIAAMIISDFFIGFDSFITRALVYGCFIFSGLLGLWLRNHKSVGTVVGASLLSSVVFFLVTNLPFVHPNSLYPYTLDGTITSYINGLPFFKNTLMGDLFYTTAFFGSFELVRAWKLRKMSLHANQGKSTN